MISANSGGWPVGGARGGKNESRFCAADYKEHLAGLRALKCIS